MSKDGEIFLHHDETFDRTTNVSGKVQDFNWSEISKINADQTRIKQCIFNLVSNASKFTNNGLITIKVIKKVSILTLNLKQKVKLILIIILRSKQIVITYR